MPVKNIKPNTPSTRHYIAPLFNELTHNRPYKPLTKGMSKKSGRNVYGRITTRHRGGGHKRRYRIIDFKRNKYDVPAKVKTIEYDPNRSSFISLVTYADGEKRYIIAPANIKLGMEIKSGQKVVPDIGNAMPLKNMPVGTTIHNIEIKPNRGAQLCRSAGSSAQLIALSDKYATLKLPSNEVRMVLSSCFATVGVVSNIDHFNTTVGKAGRNRWKGIRPTTRGVAMNPVDHPMGGGEGKASGGHPRSPWGLAAKGKKTRKKKNPSNRLITKKR